MIVSVGGRDSGGNVIKEEFISDFFRRFCV